MDKQQTKNTPSRIMLAGASGVGKTTLANKIAEEYFEIPFISGSVSDLLVNTKDMTHYDMLSRDSETLQLEDWQIINLRKKAYEGKDIYVTDRSFLDSAAYYIFKQSGEVSSCEIDHFVTTCLQLMSKYCDKLILLDFTPEMLNHWITEDNGKRITSNYFQMHISSIMLMVLKIWGINDEREVPYIPINLLRRSRFYKDGAIRGNISCLGSNFEVMILREINKENRWDYVKAFIDGKI